MDFVNTYGYIRNYLIQYGDNKRNMERNSDFEFLMSEKENMKYVEIANIVDLSVLFYELYKCNKYDLINEMEEIIEKQEIADDSDVEDIIFYHHAYFFLRFTMYPEYYAGIIGALINLGSFYETYQQNKEEYEMLVISEGYFSMNLD